MKTKSIYTRRLASGHETTWYATRRCQLWLGPDHLLHGRRSMITEQYRRLFFKDIQAVTVARTDTWKDYNIILGVLIAGCLAIVFIATSDWSMRAAWGISLCIVPVLVVAFNLAKGPTCACYFHTAVQSERIGALSRLRKAGTVLALLAPMLEQAQGSLDPAQVELVQESGRNLTLAGNEAKKQREFHPSNARYHLLFFILILISGLSHCVDLVVYSEAKNWGDLLTFLAAMLLGILAVKDQMRSLIHLDLQRITTTALVVIFVAFAASQVVGVFVLTMSMSTSGSAFEIKDWEYYGVYVAAIAVVNITLSLIGLLRLYRYRVSLRPPELPLPEKEGPAS
ncbi:MAG: hypothetical protein NTZ09_09520 [Candidatus Hydrogenedentes bacterium]|nr:hypothetical protein [Candidatus Hydrogenedentota bacterium]